MATETKKQIVPQIEEKLGMMALPYHNARSPFARSEGRNVSWQVLQDAGAKGITSADWAEELGKRGIRNPVSYVRFVQNAKRRVVVEKKDNGNWVAVAPKKPRAKKEVKPEEVIEPQAE